MPFASAAIAAGLALQGAPPSAQGPRAASRPLAIRSTRRSFHDLLMKEQKQQHPQQQEEEEDSLYNSPADFEFDAVTVTALLGAAIAFQFFVVANL
jgi:hypothetical protein